MKILVTGGAGFIGSHLVDKLLEKKHKVVAFDNLSLGRISNLENAMKNPNFEFIKGDMVDLGEYSEIFKTRKFDVVFHLAANSDIAQSHSNPGIDFNNTFLTTYNTLLAMKEHGVRAIVFASTSAVYGDTAGVAVGEDYGPLFPVSHYGAAKLASEAFITSFCENYGIKAWIARFPNVVGERATHGAIYDFINRLKANPKILEVLGNGEQTKPYLYVGDLVNAMIEIWEKTADKVNYFNIGVETRSKVKEMAEMVVEEMKLGSVIKYGKSSRGWIGDVAEFSYKLDKIHALGWKPTYSSNEAVRTAIRKILGND